jgi:hypothetical protein
MKLPRRIVEDERAAPLYVTLVQSSARDVPSAEGRARTFAALGLGAGAMTTASTAAGSTALVAKGTIAWALKIAAVSAVVSIGAWTVVHHHKAPAPDPAVASIAAAPTSSTSNLDPGVTPVVALPIATVEPDVALHHEPQAPTVARRSRPRVVDTGTLEQEIASLAEARRLLASHDANGAIRALDQYRSQYPHGALATEATVVRIEALVGRGDRATAIAMARRFLASNATGPYSRRIESLLPEVATP